MPSMDGRKCHNERVLAGYMTTTGLFSILHLCQPAEITEELEVLIIVLF
jgi:hypothetical protein